jgi:hypothetical protein
MRDVKGIAMPIPFPWTVPLAPETPQKLQHPRHMLSLLIRESGKTRIGPAPAESFYAEPAGRTHFAEAVTNRLW